MRTITIEQHFNTESDKHADITKDVSNILYDINLAAKIIRNEVITAGLNGMLGEAGETNIQGEEVKKLDLFANDTIKSILGAHGRFAMMGSEEEEKIIKGNKKGSYVLLFDPLDGSSNVDVNVSVGTIFAIYKCTSDNCSESDCLQEGYKQVAAGYVIYGSSVVMVYTAGHGVHGFTYEPNIGEFLLSNEAIRIPETAKYYSINEGLSKDLDDNTLEFIHTLKHNQTPPLSARYVGSLVADFHRNLLKGGIYIYPRTCKSPNGKLRLLYEANPLAFIVEQAGGSATDGLNRILDITPTELHQRIPLYIGNTNLVESVTHLITQTKESS